MGTTESVDFTKAIITIVTTVITIIVGGLIGYFSARRISTLNTKQVACAELRKAFAPALAILYLRKMHRADLDRPDVDGFLFKSILDHAAAIEGFRIFVPEGKRTAYQEAWEAYRKIAGDKDHGVFVTKFITEEDPYDFIAQKIHTILSFAKEK